MVIKHAIPKLGKNAIPFFSKAGKAKNKASDGITNQKILKDKSLICFMSLVSKYRKINAIIEMKGSDAKTAPQKELRFAISEIKTIKIALLIILII